MRIGEDKSAESSQKGFHQQRFKATERPQQLQQAELEIQIREPVSDAELRAVALLRALSFYAYRPERAFAGKLHQKMKASEEYERLLELRENGSKPEQQEACLAAFCRWETVPLAPEELRVTSADGEDLALVGSLDVCATRAVEGQVLIGATLNAAYLSNVCVSEAARRRSVGRSLLNEARRRAHEWGVDALYVHTMAVNEVAQHFYCKHGFVLEREETSNEAHYRGHCLDGIEGRGRTVLLRVDRSSK
ncbi:hypothetical protein KFL_006010030 [Klebsormidium nitens]|uniref:N-acetyltransferase domain-containing protein n=1 Tax=Klebsormidium nitens TaxID=105231 RepID=A0A1Y1INB0_KLENI|nr:hypothetical protein KFL_006010030 [Klebsormidium nitens]|eukprot:GAQ90107.1 hypothetical protein KFL_006010030 [Klebsormidium nitens]